VSRGGLSSVPRASVHLSSSARRDDPTRATAPRWPPTAVPGPRLSPGGPRSGRHEDRRAPAAVAFQSIERPLPLTVVARLAGSIASAGGLAASFQWDLPTGQMVVVAFAIVLLAGWGLRFYWAGSRGVANSLYFTAREHGETGRRARLGMLRAQGSQEYMAVQWVSLGHTMGRSVH
jgi:hypothetical protein